MAEQTASAKTLTQLKGVGPKLCIQLEKLGINSIADLLFHLPLRYEDRTQLTPIGSLAAGQSALVEGLIEHSAIVPARRAMLVVIIGDGSGRLSLRFFHFHASQKKQLAAGALLRCFGEVREGYRGLEMVHPTYQKINPDAKPPLDNSLSPIYPSSEGLQQKTWLNLTEQALARLQSEQLDLCELLPDDIRSQLRLPSLADALRTIHRPSPDDDLTALAQQRHPAQKILALEELLAHHVSTAIRHQQQRRRQAPKLIIDLASENQFLGQLPFQLTTAQHRVTQEIYADLANSKPMLRLVQGDVGSGKTVVAALAALCAISGGYQCAITAPTELLAEQHLNTFEQWFAAFNLQPVWLSSRVTGKARNRALEAIEGGAPLVIGTHALMQEGVVFQRLGLVIVDEQHRFGVHQRLALTDKGRSEKYQPHQLIMTATPIPRTLAMTAYAGLDTSVIDELPPGRTPVKTVAVSTRRRAEIIQRVAGACQEGRQAYWVCTLIDESEVLEAEAAQKTYETLLEQLPQLRIALVHGRLKSTEKQTLMQQFKAGDIQLLVATTVIEVGVDVPNASLMIIDNAERLGLAQLHQLRGRVGRGATESSCVLLYQGPLSKTARARLEIMRQTNDGFKIAEKDLELRGPGEVLGTRQTGLLQFRVADLNRDQDLITLLPEISPRLDKPTRKALIQRWIGHAHRYAEV